MKIIIHTDGGARGNPGPAAIGYTIEVYDGDRKISMAERSLVIGHATNNVAEYTAVREALSAVSHKEKLSIDVYLDSLLVASQLSGVYKVKDPNLKVLFSEIREREMLLGTRPLYHAVPREQNRRADALVNQALDS